ncbi:MAG: hypothetical protein ACI87E_001142 [Mariniblastus sp.]|jgi:hypothetical protein
MFVCQVLLLIGGLMTSLFAISVVVPLPKNDPFSGC